MDLADFRLCTVNGKQYAIACGESSKTFHGMIELNDSAYFLLDTLKKTGQEEETIRLAAERYGISAETVRADLKNLEAFLTKEDREAEHSARQILEEKGVLITTIAGVSMRPLLKDRRDTVAVKKLSDRLKRYDVALYESGGRVLLHRVLRDEGNAYIIRGDNCVNPEHIPDAQILGIAEGFYIKNRYVSAENGWYQCYARLWTALFPLRKLWKNARKFLGRLKRKLLKKREKV